MTGKQIPSAFAAGRSNWSARLGLLITCLCVAQVHAAPRVSIIIDDLGHSQEWAERVIALSGDITCAVLPHSPYGSKIARLAHAGGNEVILHAPMANTRGHSMGPGAMTEKMSELALLSNLLWDLAAVPYAKGVNNHMGSLLTQQEKPMNWVMRELKMHGLFFVDSRTTGRSVAAQVALEHEVPFAVRDVFLDHDRDKAKIAAAFARTMRIAQSRGRAVAIGHPYPETVKFLEANLSRLQAAGIELVPASVLVAENFAEKLAARQQMIGQAALPAEAKSALASNP